MSEVAGEYLVGIDIGTSGCKVALFTADGEVLFQGTKSYPTYYPAPGYAEQNPEEWWEAVCQNLRQMFRQTGVDPKRIKGIGVDGQSGSAIPMGKHHRPLRNSIIWLDRRSVEQYESLKRSVGEDEIFAVSGNPLSPSYVTGKILWIKEHEPDIFAQTGKMIQSNSYIVFKLSGVYTQDVSQGNGNHAFHIEQADWDYDLAERMGIPASLLPDVYESSDVVGTVTSQAAQETGLAAGTPVVAGGLDAACATLGAGAYQAGQVQEQGGQAGGMSIVMDRPVKNRKLILSRHIVTDTWILQGGTVGGGSLNWLKREFGDALGPFFFEKANDEASRVGPGSDGLIFLPYMAGERSPIWNPDAKGVFIGLSYEKTRGHIVRAIMEGCAFALQHNLKTAEASGVDIHSLYSVGGAANSELWTQIKADVTGKKIGIPSSDSAAALGAAILAGVGTGVYQSFEEGVKRSVRMTKEHHPDMVNNTIYRQAYETYLEVCENLKHVFSRLGRWSS